MSKDFQDVVYKVTVGGEVTHESTLTFYGTEEQMELLIPMLNLMKSDSDGEYTMME